MRRILGLVCLVGAACTSVERGVAVPTREVGTYDPSIGRALPPADEGDAPFAGSLGAPVHVVTPDMLGRATTTREGSGGPPFRAGAEEIERGVLPPMRVAGPDKDAW